MPESRKGLLYGVAAYALWGAFPLYWPLLKPAGAGEVLAHRVLWSCVSLGILVLALRKRDEVAAIWAQPRARRLLILAAAVVSLNWLTYIWAVNNGYVVESSLGYFINPLVTVLLGIVILGERLRPLQWAALAVAAIAVAILTLDYGRPPWVALVLACSFGTYGLAKKLAGVGALPSLTFETMLTAPLAAGYLAWLGSHGSLSLTTGGAGHAALLLSTGIVTIVPLLFFSAAAVRVPMVTLGLLQYLAPVLQFLLGVYWFHEPMPAGRWVGFVLVWAALVVFTVDAAHQWRRVHRPVPLTEPV